MSSQSSPPSTASSSFRHDINFLRAVAVVAVMLFHFRLRGFEGGYLGVDVFFVISGYLMSKVILTRLASGRFSFFGFIGMRVSRILPALIAMILVLMLLGAVLLAPLDYERLGDQAWAALLFVSNYRYLAALGYFNPGIDERWLLQTWSLSVEWQFYVVFPLVCMAIDRVARIRSPSLAPAGKTVFPLALLALFGASLVTSIVVTRSDPSAAFYLLQSRAWEMLAGALVYVAEPAVRLRSIHGRRAIQWSSFGVILLSIWLAGRHDWALQWPGYLALMPVGATSVMLLAGNDTAVPAPRWMTFGAVQKIGLWSYSIYLWHWPIVVAFNFLDIDDAHKRYGKIAGVLASFVLGRLSYRHVEQRFKHDHRRAFLQRGVVVPLAASMVVAAGAALVWWSDGWIGRTGTDRPTYDVYRTIANQEMMPAACDNLLRPRGDIEVCRINPAAGNPRVLVYGDSHAEQLYPWFAKNAQVGVDFVVMGGCPPAPGANRPGPSFRCDEFVEAALRRARDPIYSIVIVAANWANGMDRVPPLLCMASKGECDGPGHPASRAELIDANVAAWSSLLALGKTLVVVDQMPVAKFDVLPTLMRRRFLGLAPITVFDDLSGGDGRSAYLDDVVSRLPASDRLQRVSTRPEFCEGPRCSTLDETGAPVLLDTNHFVPAWIQRHGAVFRPFVTR